ncbi:MAG TPA: glycosyltransferase [Anaeromyxobacteraceae bacterium]|nr:glycosyltransferase [Anaeromyxobacteraceae bacterium]
MTALLAVFTAFGLAVFVLGLQGLVQFPLSLAYEIWKRRALRRLPPFRGRVSVVVPAYNEERTIRHSVLSILASDWPDLEVVVVNDGSADATEERVRDLAEAGRIVYRRQPNGGKASALNHGISLATGEAIVWTDADSFFEPATVRLVARWFGDRRVDAVCGNDAPLAPATALQRMLAVTTHLGTGFVRRALSLIGCLPIISGNLGAARAAVLREIGGFRRMWGEDLELTFRLQRHRKRIVFDPEPRVMADCPATLGALWRQRVRWVRSYLKVARLNRDLFFRRRWWPFSLYLPLNFANMAVVPVLQMLLLPLVAVAWAAGRFELLDVLEALAFLGVIFFAAVSVYSILLDRAWSDLRWLPWGLLILPISYFYDAVAIYSWWKELQGAEELWHKTERRELVRVAGREVQGWKVALAAAGIAIASSAGTWALMGAGRPAPAPEAARPAFHLALSTHFDAWPDWRDAIRTVEARPGIRQAEIVGVGAGRPEWVYFRWAGHEQSWANHQRGERRRDLLRTAADAFHALGPKVAAFIDLYAPRYVADHPGAAAVLADGTRSDKQVSLTELCQGPYGDLVVEMVEALARDYPLEVIDLTEASYYRASFGPADLASFRSMTGRRDWPRDARGRPDPEDPSVWEWKSALMERLVERAAGAARRHGKELWMDVSVSWKDLSREGRDHGLDWRRLLRHVDRIVPWDYATLEGLPPEASRRLASYLVDHFPPSHYYLSVGLWARRGTVSPAALAATVQQALQGGATRLWITPNDLLGEEHWKLLLSLWLPAEASSRSPDGGPGQVDPSAASDGGPAPKAPPAR